ncbi:MAG: ankyrin repeat domain-containing protein [Phycisphaerae bacterium]|nr:ankyrin repeat domain-containing protein [Phycisphaerae bacterium]
MGVEPFIIITFNIAIVAEDSKAKFSGKEMSVSDFHKAVKDGDSKKVKVYLENGGDVNSVDRNGLTALHLASFPMFSKHDNIDIIKMLLDKQADMEKKDAKSGLTPLGVAVRFGYVDAVRLLVNRGANVKILDKHNKPVLTDSPEIEEILILKNWESKKFNSKLANSFIPYAAEKGQVKLLKKAIKDGGDVNQKDIHFGVAIWNACNKKHKEAVEILIKNGADINVMGPAGTLLHIAANGNYEFWREKEAKKAALEIIKILLDKGVDPSIGDKFGIRPFETAGDEEIKKLIFMHPSCAKVDDKFGKTSLYYAVKQKDLKTAKKLIEAGADVNAKSKFARSILHIAIESREIEMVRLLIASKADINIKGNGNFYPLRVAVETGMIELVDLLISKGADVNPKKANLATPLWVASKKGYSEIVKMLLAKKADINATFTKGVTSLWIASERGHSDIVKQLLEAGANVNVKNRYGETPLSIASKNRHYKVVELLEKNGAKKN